MTTSTDLAALLCSRLCHDMLSPVGALNNGLELLADEQDPEMRKRCLELLEQSARQSAAKLKFFRLAFGAAGGFGEQVPVEEPKELIDALAANNERVTLEWALSVNSLSKPAVKVLLNLASIGLDALPRGGTLTIGAERNNGATEIVIAAAGQKVAFDASVGQALSGEMDESDLTGRTAPAHMISLIAAENGGEVKVAHTPESLVLGAFLAAQSGMIG